MQKVRCNKKIYLSGGGDEHQSFLLDSFFMQTIPQNGKILYIPIALLHSKLYDSTHIWIRGVFNVHKREDVDITLLNEKNIYNPIDLRVFDAIYIGGGNTWTLMKAVDETHLSEKLLRYAYAGGTIYGGSAGAIILGKSLLTTSDVNTTTFSLSMGLNIISEYSFACHFKECLLPALILLAKENSIHILAIPEDSGLEVSCTSIKCIGSSPIVHINKSGSYTKVQHGESISRI